MNKWMYACLHQNVCMFVCNACLFKMYVCVQDCLNACVCMNYVCLEYMHVFVCMNVCVSECMCLCMFAWIYICMHVYELSPNEVITIIHARTSWDHISSNARTSWNHMHMHGCLSMYVRNVSIYVRVDVMNICVSECMCLCMFVWMNVCMFMSFL